jgi:hypothetical protein
MSDEWTLETILTWSVDPMKEFLRKRGLTVTGSKSELAARVFVCKEMCMPVLPSHEELQRERSRQYTDILVVNGSPIPDPLNLPKESWIREKDGIKMWPPIMYWDICNFLKFSGQPSDLADRLMGDYKEGKAYSYFSSKWLKEVFYHPISADSALCFLSAQCTPSQHISNVPHNAWICAEKKTGAVKTAYCSCFAG